MGLSVKLNYFKSQTEYVIPTISLLWWTKAIISLDWAKFLQYTIIAYLNYWLVKSLFAQSLIFEVRE